jgi:hypothetical protein
MCTALYGYFTLVNDIHILPSQSSPKQIPMYFFSESLALRCKWTATECAENNGDPLATNKKARVAAKSKVSTSAPASTSTNAAPANSHQEKMKILYRLCRLL